MWKTSQTSSGYYSKYAFGRRTITFEHHPENKIAGKWHIYYHDSGSGQGYLLATQKTYSQAKTFAKRWMKAHPNG